MILAVFATYEAAATAASIYESRKSNFRYYYDIETWEVLDKAPISESKGTTTAAMGKGKDS